MIVCKIKGPFYLSNKDFANYINTLSKLGNIFFYKQELYFSSTNDKCTEKYLLSLMKRNGFKQGYIELYTKQHPPGKELDSVLYGWLNEQLLKNNVQEYQKVSQATFHKISDALNAIEDKVYQLMEDYKTEQEQQNNSTDVK